MSLKLITTVEGKIPIENSYTAGLGGEKTLYALKKQGEFIGTFCPACEYTYFPARLFCERCMEKIIDHEKRVGPNAEVRSVTLVKKDMHGRKTKPYYVGLLKFRGADTAIVHKIKVLKGIAPKPGQIASPILRRASQRRGSITDITAFELA